MNDIIYINSNIWLNDSPFVIFLEAFSWVTHLPLTTPILPCTVDEHDQSFKNSMKTLTKWFKKCLFWINDIGDINIEIFEIKDSPFVILHEGFSWVIPYRTHPASSGSESAKELPVFKMPPNEKFASADVDILFIAAL